MVLAKPFNQYVNVKGATSKPGLRVAFLFLGLLLLRLLRLLLANEVMDNDNNCIQTKPSLKDKCQKGTPPPPPPRGGFLFGCFWQRLAKRKITITNEYQEKLKNTLAFVGLCLVLATLGEGPNDFSKATAN